MTQAPKASMRIARMLAQCGVASRRKAEELVAQGLVTVNGKIVTTPGTTVDPATDAVRVDGRPVRTASVRHYLLLNKPRGYVSTRSDEKGRPTVIDLLPSHLSKLYPVGRLDVDSEGLLLMTDDGDFCLRMTHPRYGVRKMYEVRVRGVPTLDVLRRIQKGIVVEGERLRVEEATLTRSGENAWLDLTMVEGKKNEIRRLMLAAGHPVVRLRRVGIEFLTLHGVPLGRHRVLSPAEVMRLRSDRAHRPRGRARPPRPAGEAVRGA